MQEIQKQMVIRELKSNEQQRYGRFIYSSLSSTLEVDAMLGAIIGDIIGSVHEWTETKTKDFSLFVPSSRFTDDSVLTVAVADWILSGGDLIDILQSYYRAYPGRGYGGMFRRWAEERQRTAYNSFGNGSAMRVSPVGFAFETIGEVLHWAERSSAVTHSHPEGIRGAQATAAAIYYARRERNRDRIKQLIESQFGYDLSETLDRIRPQYQFDETCQGTVPQAIRAFLESTSYEDAIRNAISLGGDADTLACITGGIAEAFYGGIPQDIAAQAKPMLDQRLTEIIRRFRTTFGFTK
jgi:ADP-ribosylglycohydrolase